jgi:chitinase
MCACTLFSVAQDDDDSDPGQPIVVGYFPGWAVHKHYLVKNLISSEDTLLLDQINYSQGHVVNNECAIADPDADLNFFYSADDSVDGVADSPQMLLRGNFHQLLELKRRFPQVKIVISLEGNPSVFVEAAQPANRVSFVSSCIKRFVEGKFADGIEVPGLFDGIDIDWEYPKEADKFNFVALLGEFRRQLNAAAPNLLLTVAMGDGRITYEHLDMEAVSLYVDQVGIMNYDYSGPWSQRTGLIAPLYSSPGDPEKNNDVDSTIRGYRAAGVPESKMLLGLPFYAYSWSHVAPDNNGLFQMGKPSRIDAPYNAILEMQDKFTTYRDPKSMAPWLFDGQTFWTYDDEVSITAKLKYAIQQELHGVMIWELSGDTTDGKLLHTISGQFKNQTRETP